MFLYPWAVAFDQLAVFGLIEMLFVHLDAGRRLRMRMAPPRFGVGLMGLEEKLPSRVLLTTRRGGRRGTRAKGSLASGVRARVLRHRMMATGAPRYDLARFGAWVFRASRG